MSSLQQTSGTPTPTGTQNLADILERILDKGIVIAGDIQINLLDIELLTIKLRLLVASVDKAREIGIDWWESEPSLSSDARNGALEDRLGRLEEAVGLPRSESSTNGAEARDGGDRGRGR